MASALREAGVMAKDRLTIGPQDAILPHKSQRISESGKQTLRFRTAVDQILRMPLDGDREPAIISLQRLGVALPGSG